MSVRLLAEMMAMGYFRRLPLNSLTVKRNISDVGNILMYPNRLPIICVKIPFYDSFRE